MQLSIITIAYNNLAGLRKTVESVLCQTYTDFEYIVVDGGSQDGSKDYLQSQESVANERNLSYIWLSEPDKGIYNAMNKGLRLAKGEYVLFLNSGDYLVSENILQLTTSYEWKDDLIYCNMYGVPSNGNKKEMIYSDHISAYYLWKSALPHQASFFKRSVLLDFDMYREDLKYASDWEMCIRMFVNNQCSYIHIPIFLTCFDLSGIGSSSQYQKEMLQERDNVFNTLCPSLIWDFRYLKKLEQQVMTYDKKAEKIGKAILFIPRWIKRVCAVGPKK